MSLKCSPKHLVLVLFGFTALFLIASIVLNSYYIPVFVLNEGEKISDLRLDCHGKSEGPSIIGAHTFALVLLHINEDSDLEVNFKKDDGKSYGIKRFGYFERSSLGFFLLTVKPSGSVSIFDGVGYSPHVIESGKTVGL